MVEELTVSGVDGKRCSHHRRPRNKEQGRNHVAMSIWDYLIVNCCRRAQANMSDTIPWTGDLGLCKEAISVRVSISVMTP